MPDALLPRQLAPEMSAEMHPVSVGQCFGWLHMPPRQVVANAAVLLCPGLRDDALTAHSHLRLLANALAEAGYPTLRFDYPGTGDSCDPDPRDNLWTVWTGSAHEAADWLRRTTGAERLVLCGLRLGAILAADVARERADVAALMLLAPLARGRTFVRQLEVEAKLSGKVQTTGLMLNGAPLSTDSQRAIASLELQAMVPPPGCSTAIFSATPAPVIARCAESWAGIGATVDQREFAGLDIMLRSRVMSHEAAADVSPLTDWLESKVPARPGGCGVVPPPALSLHPGCRETPLQFGPAGGLFGMVCQPLGQGSGRAVLILNSGGDPHYGQDRSALCMARQFAAAGIASLRMDFAGLGDSVTPGDTRTHVFETDRRPEISAALDALAAAGFRSFSVYGLCSGAYHAFHAAAADARIDSLLLINLPVLQWDAGTKIESFALTERNLAVRARKLRMPLTWIRLVRGHLHIRNRALAVIDRTVARLARARRQSGTKAPENAVRHGWHRMSGRTRTLLLMSPIEVGLAALQKEFGPSRTAPGMVLHVLLEIDHSMTTVEMRRSATGMMIDFLAAGRTKDR